MQLHGHEDLRIQKTVTAIHDTFRSLLLEADYDKITVTELCKRAKINKKTFYRYYETLDALLEEEMETLSRGYLERIAEFRVPEDLAAVNREFFHYAAMQGKLYERIVCGVAHHAISGKMLNDLTHRTWNTSASFRRLDTDEQNLLLAYISNFGATMYRQWILDGKRLPLETIIELSNALLCHGVDGFMKKNT